MAAGKGYFHVSIALLLFFLVSVCCLPEPGKKDLNFTTNQTLNIFAKTMNKGYSVAIKGNCEGVKNVSITWRLYVTQCAESFSFLKTREQDQLNFLWEDLGSEFSDHSLNSTQEKFLCNPVIHLPDLTDVVKELIYTTPAEESNEESKPQSKDDKEKASPAKEKEEAKPQLKDDKEKASTAKEKTKGDSASAPEDSKSGSRKKRSAENEGNGANASPTATKEEKDTSAPPSKASPTATKEEKDTAVPPSKKSNSEPVKEGKEASSEAKKVKNQVCATKRDGVFLLIVEAIPDGDKKDNFKLTLNVEMKGQHGYLSASDWPLYPFYGCMSLLYVFYGIVWLIVSACQWRDLLRIQFWIGGVIALGMLEKAVFFSEYNNINITGETNPGLTVFAELVSCVKRTLARILVIIVSMGFGIVKPRLGTTLHRVLGVGALYFILATVEGCFRSLHPKSDPGKQQLIASIPLAVLDASICWWIFMSLVQTTRTLRIRRNLVKLSLYRHFTNTLIFAVLASVAYMIWSIKTHRFAKDGCITNWSELWLDEAFWHFLFSIVLLVIMVLWRPTANNQRYAFTPIVDFGDDDDDDENMTLSDAFDGMKMRNVKNTPEVIINGDTKRKHKPEDDLKWVEENIPSSAADAVLPSVLDSDEELMTTKFEMSKME